jgi:hypothetical protein
MSAPAIAAADDVLWAHRFAPSLEPAGAVTWRAGGRVEALAALPDGDLTALVSTEAGRTALLRWGPGGKERSRQSVELGGKVRSARAGEDGGLVVATEAEAVRFGPDGAVVARRPLPPTPAAAGGGVERGDVQAAVDGVWLLDGGVLRFVGLGQPDATATLPAPAAGETLDASRTWLYPTAQGDCLVAAWRTAEHTVLGRGVLQPDRPGHLVLSLISRRGEQLASRDEGTVRTRLEWFWRESGGPQAWGPGAFGPVRRRHEDGPHLCAVTSRADGDLVFFLRQRLERGDEVRAVRLDGRLRERWSRAWTHEAPEVLSPPWSRGLLAVAGSHVLAFDEGGSGVGSRAIEYPPGAVAPGARGFVVGQEPSGAWVVVEWGTPEAR